MEQNCIVWGAGNYGRRLIPMLKEEGFAIKAFCDTNAELNGEKKLASDSGSFFRMLEQADFGETGRWDRDVEDEKCI